MEQFRTELMEELRDRLGDGYIVMPCETLKNNGLRLYGVIMRRKNEKIAPTVYLEKIFSDYGKHGDIKHAADEVIKINEKYGRQKFDAHFYEKYENIKDKLYVKLVSRDENEEMLKNTPHRDFMDLTLIAYCDVSAICKFDASIVVKREHLKLWGVNEDDMLDLAIDNTRDLGCCIRDVADFLRKRNGRPVGLNIDTDMHRRMYVMTNKNLFFGAICMTYDDRLDEFCSRNNCNTYIIPSSVHEVILVPDKGQYSDAEINCMIRDVNRCELTRDEILSNHAYYYSVQDGYTCV